MGQLQMVACQLSHILVGEAWTILCLPNIHSRIAAIIFRKLLLEEHKPLLCYLNPETFEFLEPGSEEAYTGMPTKLPKRFQYITGAT